MNELFLDSK